MSKPAKIEPQITQNQADGIFSATELVLLHRYHAIYETLFGMEFGGSLALRPEVHRQLVELLGKTGIAENDNLASRLNCEREQNLADEDYALRRETENTQLARVLPEHGVLGRLMKANSPRTIRKLVNQSRWLRESMLGRFLRAEPTTVLAIKLNPRFPKSLDRRIDFLARSIAAALTKLEPSTGCKYLATLVDKCGNCERPAALELEKRNALCKAGRIFVEEHRAEDCRDSTFPCPVHHPSYPSSLSGIPWCGVC